MEPLEADRRYVKTLTERYPALQAFLQPLEPFFEFYPRFQTRLYAALSQTDGSLEASLRDLESQGILPGLDPDNFDHLITLWSSRLFEVYLDSIGFSPPPETRLGSWLPAPTEDLSSFRERCEFVDSRYGTLDHWESVLQKSCPEVFLSPFLRESQREGADIACGWGRGTFSLLGRSDFLKLHCCDHSRESLELLEVLAAREDWSDRIETHPCVITELPLADSAVGFMVGFDIFELMPTGPLQKLLDEVIRVCRPDAVLYFKITLNAYRPTLGQVQNFTPRKVKSLFEGRKVDGKSMVLLFHDRRVPEHFTFQITDGVTPPRALSLSSTARSPAKSRAARLSRLRRK